MVGQKPPLVEKYFEGGQIYTKGTAWAPGNGQEIDFWNFSWILNSPLIRILVQIPLNKNDMH